MSIVGRCVVLNIVYIIFNNSVSFMDGFITRFVELFVSVLKSSKAAINCFVFNT